MIDTQNWITLIQLNNIIQSHGYGYTESDTKPNPINRGQTIDADFVSNLQVHTTAYFHKAT